MPQELLQTMWCGIDDCVWCRHCVLFPLPLTFSLLRLLGMWPLSVVALPPHVKRTNLHTVVPTCQVTIDVYSIMRLGMKGCVVRTKAYYNPTFELGHYNHYKGLTALNVTVSTL